MKSLLWLRDEAGKHSVYGLKEDDSSILQKFPFVETWLLEESFKKGRRRKSSSTDDGGGGGGGGGDDDVSWLKKEEVVKEFGEVMEVKVAEKEVEEVVEEKEVEEEVEEEVEKEVETSSAVWWQYSDAKREGFRQWHDFDEDVCYLLENTLEECQNGCQSDGLVKYTAGSMKNLYLANVLEMWQRNEKNGNLRTIRRM